MHVQLISSVAICFVVTPKHFENVTDVIVHETTTVLCRATYDTNIVWHYEQFCDDFEHGLYACSRPVAIAVGHQYQIRTNGPGEHSLLIVGVTKNMTGLYTCRNRHTQTAIDSVMINTICNYCLSNAMHSIGQSIKSPERPACERTCIQLF